MTRIRKAFQIFDEDGDIEIGEGWFLVIIIACLFYSK